MAKVTVWQPVEDADIIRGVELLIEANGLDDYADCRLCRQVEFDEPEPAVPVNVLAYLIEVCESERDGMRDMIATMGSEFASKTQLAVCEQALAWLNTLAGLEATDGND